MAKRRTRVSPRIDEETAGGSNGAADPGEAAGSANRAGLDDLPGAVQRHDQALEELGGRVEWVLSRQEWIQSGLYDLNLSLAALNEANGAEARSQPPLGYARSVRDIRETVRRALPRDATVVVVSKGDNALLDLYGRQAEHFPQALEGVYAGYYLPDGTGLTAHLEVLRARGADYLLFPASSLWWLESYPKFAQHLRRHYPVVIDDPEICVIFSLERYAATDPSAWQARLRQLVDDYSAEHGEEPCILDCNTGLDLDELLPHQAVFSPPSPGSELPYLDNTADVVVVDATDDHLLSEAQRVSRRVVMTLEPAENTGGDPAAQFTVEVRRTDADTPGTAVSSSIVIPTYDGWGQLDLCLAALNETLPDAFGGEVIVVDDGSRTETQGVVAGWSGRAARLNLKIVRNPSNCGFTESCNRGAAVAEGDVLVFLNDDTLPQIGWLSALVRTFREHANVGAVGGRLLYPDGSLQEAGNVIFADGSGANFGRGDFFADDPLYSYVRDVDYCSAALLATPRDLFEEIGGFDERYSPAYYEDTDYCFAVRHHGRRVLYQPESVVVHVEGATSGTDLASGVKRFQLVNQPKFVEKWRKELAQQPQPPDRYDLRTWHSLARRGSA